MGTESYTIGKGKLLFKADGETNYRDLGNCTDFKVNISKETKEHYSSRSGIQSKDMEVLIKQTAKGSFTLDELVDANLKMFIMSNAITTVSQTSGNQTDQEITAELNRWLELGKREVSNVVVKNQAGTVTYVVNQDYLLDAKAGLIMPIATITNEQVLKVSYSYAATTIKRLDAATTTTIKGHVWFVGAPATGTIIDLKGYVAITPTGDMGFISEDWTQIGFEMDFLTHQSYNGNFELHIRGNV